MISKNLTDHLEMQELYEDKVRQANEIDQKYSDQEEILRNLQIKLKLYEQEKLKIMSDH